MTRPRPDARPRLTPGERIRALLVAEGDCLVFTGQRDMFGYGRLEIKGKRYKASRVAYAEAHGPIPDGFVVMHSCDNPPCCNLDHLSLGTQADNIASGLEDQAAIHDMQGLVTAHHPIARRLRRVLADVGGGAA